jgi:hypothetical protein
MPGVVNTQRGIFCHNTLGNGPQKSRNDGGCYDGVRQGHTSDATKMRYLIGIWDMAVEAAPWLLLGLIAAGIVKAWAPKSLIARHLGGTGVGGVLRASVIGIPLPLCSCGVLPTALALRRQGASRPATASFLVSTPEVGLDSIALSYALLGPVMAVARPVAALVSAVAAGLAAVAVNRREPAASNTHEPPPSESGPHADGPAATPANASNPGSAGACWGGEESSAGACCGGGTEAAEAEPPTGAWPRLAEGMGYVFSRLLDDIKWWLAVAIVVAGVLTAFFDQPAEALQAVTSGAWAPVGMLAMVVIGVPLYICATGSTPLAAGLLVAGVSPGTVLVLLLAGPATNLGAVAILRKELGVATVAAYLGAIAGVSIAAGLTLDWLAGVAGWNIVAQAGAAHAIFPRPVAVASAVLLIGLCIRPLRKLSGKVAAAAVGARPTAQAPAEPTAARGR